MSGRSNSASPLVSRANHPHNAGLLQAVKGCVTPSLPSIPPPGFPLLCRLPPRKSNSGCEGSIHTACAHMDAQDDSQPAAKRRKTKLACEVCRDRKVRCDGVKPVCGSCSRRKPGTERCVYVDPGADLHPEYVRSLEDRIRELERGRRGSSWQSPPQPPAAAAAAPFARDAASPAGTHTSPGMHRLPEAIPGPTPIPHHHVTFDAPPPQGYAELHVSSATDGEQPTQTGGNYVGSPGADMQPGIAMGAAEGTPTESGRTVFLGRSSAAAFMKEVQETSGSRRRSGGVGAEDATSSSASRASYFRNKKDQDELNSLMENLILPPRRVADTHLAKYWELVHPLYPILHRPTFMNRYATNNSSPQAIR